MTKTMVVGLTFTDIKGFCAGEYHPRERNLGSVAFCQGGVSRNVALNLARAGQRVGFASMVDDSALGHDALRCLQEEGVDVRHVRAVPERGMGMWMVILDENGDVAGQISCVPDVSQLEALWEQEGEEILAGADNIVLEIDTTERLVEQVLTAAQRLGKPVYPIVGNMSVILRRRDFLARCGCFICNELEAGRLFDTDLSRESPERVLAFLLEQPWRFPMPPTVITMGGRGVVYADYPRGTAGYCPAIPTALLDSSGAGDAFLSGTVAALGRGYTLEEAVRVGTRMASLTIRTAESACPRCNGIWQDVPAHALHLP